jgi:hypothetical protein
MASRDAVAGSKSQWKGGIMSGPNCHNCVYSVCDQEAWLRSMRLGEPILPTCANHPQWPGQMHEVPGVPCRNYRRKPAVPQGDVRLIPLADGFYAYVDAADYEWLSRWKWYMVSGGYAARSGKGGQTYMHRQIMQPPKGMVVDHHDGNKANNCRLNLRVCTQQENRRNNRKRRDGRSRFKGVYRRKHGGVSAQFWFEGRTYWLGYFPDEILAARAYDRAAVEAGGEFANPNFPKEWPPERRRRVHARYLRTGELSIIRKRARRRAKSSSTRCRGESSFARTRTGLQGTRMQRKEPKRDMGKPQTNKKKANLKRKPHPTRRKMKKLPQRSQRPRIK